MIITQAEDNIHSPTFLESGPDIAKTRGFSRTMEVLIGVGARGVCKDEAMTYDSNDFMS